MNLRKLKQKIFLNEMCIRKKVKLLYLMTLVRHHHLFMKRKKTRKSKQTDKLTLGSYFKLNDIYTSTLFDVHWIDILFFFLSLSLISQLLLLRLPPAIRGALTHTYSIGQITGNSSPSLRSMICILDSCAYHPIDWQ